MWHVYACLLLYVGASTHSDTAMAALMIEIVSKNSFFIKDYFFCFL
jgi:hypothetical protein